MTREEAIEIITNAVQTENMTVEQDKALSVIQKDFEEIQQYRAIGTVEKCREAMEKQMAKKPVLNENSNVMFCPVCERKVKRNYDLHCSGCGQAIDWSEVN